MKFTPKPPQWALDAGLPEPEPREDFCDYVTRLGLDCSELFEGLTPRTMVVAQMRLAQKLADETPDVWRAHVERFVKQHARPKKEPKPVPFRW